MVGGLYKPKGFFPHYHLKVVFTKCHWTGDSDVPLPTWNCSSFSLLFIVPSRWCLCSASTNAVIARLTKTSCSCQNFGTNFPLMSVLPSHWLLFIVNSNEFYFSIHTLTYPDFKTVKHFCFHSINIRRPFKIGTVLTWIGIDCHQFHVACCNTLINVIVCRAALDIIKRHDGIYKQKKAYRDVFLPEAIMLRDRCVLFSGRFNFRSWQFSQSCQNSGHWSSVIAVADLVARRMIMKVQTGSSHACAWQTVICCHGNLIISVASYACKKTC